VAGHFTHVNDVEVNHIARLNNGQWQPLGSGLSDFADVIEIDGSTVYAAGVFTSAGGTPARNIARWNGVEWNPLGEGIHGDIYTIAAADGSVFVGGVLDSAGGKPVAKLARWDGTQWHALGSGFHRKNSIVFDIVSTDNGLYVGGNLYDSSGTSIGAITRWTGLLSSIAANSESTNTLSLQYNANGSFHFSLPQADHIRLAVYDILGRKITTLHNGLLAAGEHSIAFDKSSLPSGMYLVRLRAEHGSAVVRVVVY
jgi:hypothetical protein